MRRSPRWRRSRSSLERNIENYHFREALKDAMNFARIGNKYLADTEPWKVVKSDPERVKTILYLALQITASTGDRHRALHAFLGREDTAHARRRQIRLGAPRRLDLIGEGHRIGTPELLFEKIEDDVIARQLDKLAAIKAANKAAEASQNAEKQKDNCSFDEFQKMDVRVSRRSLRPRRSPRRRSCSS